MKKVKISLCANIIMAMAIFPGAGWAGSQAAQDPPNPEPAASKIGDSGETASGHWEGEIYPKSQGPHPVVVLVSGSGKQNRDEAFMGL